MSKPDLNKTKVLLVLFLLPMALGTTSLINNMNSGSKDMFSLSADVSDILNVVNQTFGPDNEALDLDDDGTNDTTLEFSITEETPEDDPWTDSSDEGQLTLRIVATSDSSVTINDGTCDCDTVQTIYLDIEDNLADLARKNCAEQSLGSTGPPPDADEIAECNQEFEDALMNFIRGQKGVIARKLNEQRLAQHEENVEEKNCDNKDDVEDKIECFINTLSELDRSDDEQREEILSNIEEHMEELNYSDEDDREIFDNMMDELSDISVTGVSALRSKLRRHRNTREYVNDRRDNLGELQARIDEANRQINSAQQGMAMAESAFNNSQKTPWDFYTYQQRVLNYQQRTNLYQNEHMHLTSQFSRQRDSLQRQSLNLIGQYQEGGYFDQSDVDLATRYATTGYNFPHHQPSIFLTNVPRQTPTRSTGQSRINLTDRFGDNFSYLGPGGAIMQYNPGYLSNDFPNMNNAFPNVASPNTASPNMGTPVLTSPGIVSPGSVSANGQTGRSGGR